MSRAIHTIESLLARTEEVGECREWAGYCGNRVPAVSHEGKMVPVRRLLTQLQGKEIKPGWFYSTSCKNDRCVEPAHILARHMTKHMTHMANSELVNPHLRNAKIVAYSRAHRSKLTMEKAEEIRASDESGPVVAARFGITRSLVSKIRRYQAWHETQRSPFAGLGAR